MKQKNEELIHCKNGSSFYLDKGTAPALRGKSTKLYYDGGVMTKHTAGPWEISHIDSCDGFMMITTAKGLHAVAVVPSEGAPMPEYGLVTRKMPMQDNARLIAAAPELLEALSALADCAGISALPGYKPELDAAMIKARAAIAKAEGAL